MGNHVAATCAECPQGNGAAWCNDECMWSSSTATCVVPVQCGNHFAATCAECPQGNGAAWCNDDCKWSSSTSTCVVPVSCGGNHVAATCGDCPQGNGAAPLNGNDTGFGLIGLKLNYLQESQDP